MIRFVSVLLICLLSFGPVFAVEPDEILDDPALEQRARDISAHLRCLVCQNQSIDDSDADLAKDLRVLVRERLVAGDSNEEAMQYIVDRYGEFVLLNPVIAPHTVVLWGLAPAIFVGGLVALVVVGRRKKTPGNPTKMSAEEKAALAELTKTDD